MSALRKIQLFSLTILLLAGLSMSAPAPALAFGGGGGHCIETWCHDECVGDLAGFCEEEAGCEAEGSQCSVEECLGIDGEDYDYTIECGEGTAN